MAVAKNFPSDAGRRWLSGSLDVERSTEETFALICAVAKWPVWLPFLKSARVLDGKDRAEIGTGSEIVVRSTIPGEEEQLYEVESFIANYHLSLVGAYSCRRRMEFRIENRTLRSRVHVRVSYPSYGGRLGSLIDGWRNQRKLNTELDHGLMHFKGLVEFRRDDAILADF
ncbi:MAG TPA: hypothetical protein VGF18_08610 [Candidatus Tumulicola sp.]|jgi:uncharacterized membrane protein